MGTTDHRLRAEHVARAGRLKPWTARSVRFELVEGPDVTEQGLLRVVVRATKDGREVPVENPYYFVNPPVRLSKRTAGTPASVLKRIVADVVLGGE